MEKEKGMELSRDALRLIAGERLLLGLCRGFLYELSSQLKPWDPLQSECNSLLQRTATSTLHEKLQIPDTESGVDWDQFLTPYEIEQIKLGH